jgi:hypothetical protein
MLDIITKEQQMNTHHRTPDITTSFRIASSWLEKMDYYCQNEEISRSALIRKLIKGFEPLRNIEIPKQTYSQWSK